MQDLIVVATITGFFGLCLALVAGCGRILGPAETDTHDHESLEFDNEPEPYRTAA